MLCLIVRVCVCSSNRTSFSTPNESTKNTCCLKHVFLRMCFSSEEKCTLQNVMLFSKWAPFNFRLCFLPLTGHSEKMIGEAQFRFL